VRAGELLGLQLQVLERRLVGSTWKVLLNIFEFGQKLHELLERNLCLGMQLHHLLDYTAKFELPLLMSFD
jgi:hypothetical protein